MKRLLSVNLVLVLVCALAVSVMAAESYVFYRSDVVPLADFYPSGNIYVYDGVLPAGDYTLRIDFFDGATELSYYVDDVLTVEYSPFYFSPEDLTADGCLFEFTVSSESLVQNVQLFIAVIPDGDYTIALMAVDGELRAGTFLTFEPVALSPIDSALASVDSLGQLFGLVLAIIMNNWFLAVVFCMSLIGLGAVVVRNLKRAK